MTSPVPLCTTTSPMKLNFKTRLMQWALVISLLSHGGAALLVIIFSGFSTSGKHSANLTIQEIELSPSLTAPSQPLPPPAAQLPAMAVPPPLLETEKPVQEPLQEPPAALQPPATENAGKEGGLISTPLGLGMTHGYFSMLADGKTLRDDVRAYYSEMVEKINREWWDKAGLLKDPLREDGFFEIIIHRDGTIEAQQLVRSTGSSEADRVIAEIIKKASPLPPLPSSYPLEQFRAPLRIKAPLSLFRMRD
jgi:TonB family protein